MLKGSSMSLGYIGGFFDGEGSILIQKNNKKNPPQHFLEVQITNTNRQVLDLMREYVRLGRISHDKCKCNRTTVNGERYKNIYRWRMSSNEARKFLFLVLPFIYVKEEEAVVGIAFQDSITARVEAVGYLKLDSATLNFRDMMKEKLEALREREQIS